MLNLKLETKQDKTRNVRISASLFCERCTASSLGLTEIHSALGDFGGFGSRTSDKTHLKRLVMDTWEGLRVQEKDLNTRRTT